MACKNGVCGLKKKGKNMAKPPITQPVLPQKLKNDMAIPAVVNAAQTGPVNDGAAKAAIGSPLRNGEKDNYKLSQYLRHATPNEARDAYIASQQGALAGLAAGAGAGPYAAAAGAAAGGIGGIMPAIANWAKRTSINNKIKHYVGKLNDYLKRPNQNDPKLMQKIQHAQARMNELAPGVLAPGQEKLPAEQQQQIIDTSVKAANERGSQAEYEGKAALGNGGNGGQQGNTFQLSRYTAPQVGLQNELINRLQNKPADFGAIRDAELRRFRTETHPQALEQAYGSNPYQSGSGQEYQLQKSSESLAERLAAMQSKFELQQEGNYLQSALQPTFENIYTPPAPPVAPWYQSLLQNAGPAAIEHGAKAFGNWMDNRGNQQANQPVNVSNKYQTPVQQGNPANPAGDQGNQFSPWDPQASQMIAAEQKAIGANALQQLNARNKQLGGGN